MSQAEVKEVDKEVPIEVLIKEVNELLKRYELRGETRMMNRSAVARLCGTIESRRISKAKQIETVAKATGRYPYVVFAFQSERGVLCVPDGNYYVADGMYDVHIVDCNGDNGVKCAEVAANVADIFAFPISREALLMLASEAELCANNILQCRKRGEERPEAPPVERREAGTVEVPAVVNEIKKMLLAMRDSMRQGQQPTEQQPAPAAPAQSPSTQPPPAPQRPAAERPDPKSVLKEFGLGWLANVVDDPAAAAALRFVVENRDVLDALKSEEKRKMIVQAVKEGGVPAAPSMSPLDKALEKWSPKEREKLLTFLSKTKDLYSLASALTQYLTNDDHCTFDVAREIMNFVAERYGITCEVAAKAMSR